MENSVFAKPFVKWAGGKTQLLDEIRKKYPKTIRKYCEPFVGGGAVLFDVLNKNLPEEVLINDINPQLINVYVQIRDNCDLLIDILSHLKENYISKSTDDRKESYLENRSKYNEGILKNTLTTEMAALFIFLNRTCFNGLYRVNSKGLFNVPIGSYKNPLICDEENLRAVSKLLQGVNIKCGDYSKCESFIDKDTFVYIDPPYRPLTQTASFTAYSESGFGDSQQIELGRFMERISKKGAKIVASNSDPKNVNAGDLFFDDIYKQFIIYRVKALRMINSKSSGRGVINELLISNF